MASFKLVLAVLVCVAIAGPMAMKAAADVNCNQVTADLGPCLGFLTSDDDGKPPSEDCCNSVRNVDKKADTTPARQQTCECLKNDIKAIPAIKPKKAAALPDDCNVKLPFIISADTDCKKIK